MSQQQARKISTPVIVLIVLLMAGEWILLVAGAKIDEMIVGFFSVVAAALFLLMVCRSEEQFFDFRVADLIACWRVPWYLISGIWEITVVLLKDIFSIERAGSLYRVSGFATSGRDPRLIARRVLAVTYATVAPNFIVIGIDYRQSRMLFHQLKRSSVSRMTLALGAQSGSRP